MAGNETEQNSLREGKRLEQEIENSKQHHNHKSGEVTDFVCKPTQVDAYVKFELKSMTPLLKTG